MISKTDKKLAEMQTIQLEMLHELDRVCKILNINYCLSSGTCLGAVRHQGFIPWDDDVDVYMKWDDAEKLAQNNHLFADKYFVQSKKTDPGAKKTLYRLRDSTTSYFLEEDLGCDMNHGIFLDIYILYPYPDNTLRAKKLILDSFFYLILQAHEPPRNHGKLVQMVGKAVLKLYPPRRAARKIEKVERAYRTNGGKRYYATYFGRDIHLFSCITYPQEWFDDPTYLQFEDLQVPCPKDVKRYCELQYGPNYMELPPEEKRTPHHDYVFYSADVPYETFKGKYY